MDRKSLLLVSILVILGWARHYPVSLRAEDHPDFSAISSSTFLGGSDEEGFHSVMVAIDGDGYVFVAGITKSEDFPTTPGAYDETHNGEKDIFVSKFDPSLSTLLASTFIGGGATEFSCSLAIDDEGDVYVAGVSDSQDFPTTEDAYDVSPSGGYDFVVSKLDNGLSSLITSTYLGGLGRETAARLFMALREDSVYVTGLTESSNFPTTPGAYDESYNGGGDSFVSKLDGDLQKLLSSTYVGGSGNDWAYSIGLDADGGVYVTGHTDSSDYPVIVGGHDGSYNGDIDVFVTRLDAELTVVVASTFVGGSQFDNTASIAVDMEGRVYVSGHTASWDYPTTPNAYESEYSGGNRDVFVTSLDGDLSMLASTFLGGAGSDFQPHVVTGAIGVIVSGSSDSRDFPVTSGSGQSGRQDYFLSRMDSALSSLLASVLIGGSDEELFGGVSHSGGEVYVSGSTASGSFPVTDGVYDESFNGGDMDIFVMRFSSYGSGIDDHTSENGREERSGIPGFPYESILLGVVSAILVLWSIQRRR